MVVLTPCWIQTATVITEFFVEYDGQQINVSQDTLLQKVQEAYKAEGHRVGSIKKIQIYLNLQERRAYYVINDKSEGRFVEL